MQITEDMFVYRVGRLPSTLELELCNNTYHPRIESQFCGWDKEFHLPRSITNSVEAPDGWSARNTRLTIRTMMGTSMREITLGVFKAPAPRHTVKQAIAEALPTLKGETSAEKVAELQTLFIQRGWLIDPNQEEAFDNDPRREIREYMMENDIPISTLAKKLNTTNKEIKKIFRMPITTLWFSTLFKLSDALGLRPDITFCNKP